MYHFWYKRGIPLLKYRLRLILAYFCFKGHFRLQIRLKIVYFSRKYKVKSRQIKENQSGTHKCMTRFHRLKKIAAYHK